MLVGLVTPHAPEGKRGRPPFAVETMLRIHFMQWFTLSDPDMEEALHDVPLFREFAGPDNWNMRLPDDSTILRFRHLFEKDELAGQMLETINTLLSDNGLLPKAGTVVAATLIAAPSSTKNASGERDPEMHQTKKGNQWFRQGSLPRPEEEHSTTDNAVRALESLDGASQVAKRLNSRARESGDRPISGWLFAVQINAHDA
jgi:IS5 family transposase